MKIRFTILTFLSLLIVVIGCKKDSEIIKPGLKIVGEWKYQYELLEDGTKEYKNPYALLDFEYSDGFILKENNLGHSVWYDKVNGNFEWTMNDSKLIFTVTKADNSVEDFEYQISNQKEDSMMFESLDGSHFFMIKK